MEKIWLKSYPEGVPAEINADAYSSITEIFTHSCEKFHDRPAIQNMGTQLSYGELALQAKYFAAYLQQILQLQKGSRFAIMLPNILQYPVALFGALQAGLIIVNTNPLYTVPELIHQLNDAEVEAIIVLANFVHVLQDALPHTQIKHVIVTELGDLFNFPKNILINSAVKYLKKMVPAWDIPHAIRFSTMQQQGEKSTFEPVTITNQDIAFLQYTGGTTGVAKGAMLTHRNLIANMLQASAWIGNELQAGKEIIITALPLYHIFSLTANCLVFMEIGALNVLITNPRDIPGFVKEISKIPFTAFTGVNTLFNALINNQKFKNLDFSSLRMTLGGGMAVHASVAQRWCEITGKPLIEAYGLTETSPAVTINPLTLKTFNGSIGLPIPSTEIALLDDKGDEVSLNTSGELCVKGPQVMKGYWKNLEETQKVFTKEGWLRTGDIAAIDNDGFVRIVDRKKDLIIVSGFNVYPNEVENVIMTCPGVLEVAVIGVPDTVVGENVKAFIVRKNPALTQEEILNHCHQYLTKYKIPKFIEFVDKLPKSNVGKILRRALRDH